VPRPPHGTRFVSGVFANGAPPTRVLLEFSDVHFDNESVSVIVSGARVEPASPAPLYAAVFAPAQQRARALAAPATAPGTAAAPACAPPAAGATILPTA